MNNEALSRLWRQESEYPDEPLRYDLSMEHETISPDGRLIAAGHQCSPHCVFDADTLEVIAEVGHLNEYPHYAAFSEDGNVLALNSCHVYNGETVGVPTDLLPGLKTLHRSMVLLIVLLSLVSQGGCGQSEEIPAELEAYRAEAHRATIEQVERILERELTDFERQCVVTAIQDGRIVGRIKPPLSETLKQRKRELEEHRREE